MSFFVELLFFSGGQARSAGCLVEGWIDCDENSDGNPAEL
jgi:hypothetical protein